MADLREHLMNEGFQPIHGNEFENKKANFEFKGETCVITYNNGKSAFVDETKDVNVFKNLIDIFR